MSTTRDLAHKDPRLVEGAQTKVDGRFDQVLSGVCWRGDESRDDAKQREKEEREHTMMRK